MALINTFKISENRSSLNLKSANENVEDRSKNENLTDKKN